MATSKKPSGTCLVCGVSCSARDAFQVPSATPGERNLVCMPCYPGWLASPAGALRRAFFDAIDAAEQRRQAREARAASTDGPGDPQLADGESSDDE